jgi:hypothetical protein
VEDNADTVVGLFPLQQVDLGHGAHAARLIQFLTSLYPFLHIFYRRKNEIEVEYKHIKSQQMHSKSDRNVLGLTF